MKPDILSFAILFFSLFNLLGCSQSKPSGSYRPPTYNQSEVITFDDIQYQISDIFWTNQIGPSYFLKKPNAAFLVIDLSLTNKSQKPVEKVYSPIFRLEDSHGAVYEPTTTAVLRQGLGIKMMLEPINPNVTIRGYLVFDIPDSNRYKLRILSPFYARESFSSSIQVVGLYFYFTLSPTKSLYHFEEK